MKSRVTKLEFFIKLYCNCLDKRQPVTDKDEAFVDTNVDEFVLEVQGTTASGIKKCTTFYFQITT